MTDLPQVQAIIPARGGSRGIPRKNLQKIGGIPLVARSVLVARESSRIRQVYVSTDDEEIARIAAQYGADIIMRPTQLALDSASSESALVHALEIIEESGALAEFTSFIQCTSPFLEPEYLNQGIEKFFQKSYDSMFSATRFHGFLWKKTKEGCMRGVNHGGAKRKLRQDLEPDFLENGAFYLFKTREFLEKKDRFFGKIGFYEMPGEHSLEIDDTADLELARALARNEQGIKGKLLPKPVGGVVFDFDGVFTDNSVYLSQDGIESVRCDRGDGMGIDLLRKAGIPMVVISKEKNPVVARRCEKLQLEVFHGVEDKFSLLEKWALERRLDLASLVYLGNDVNDLGCLKNVGCGVCVADAHPAVFPLCKIILEKKGGYGAIRELSNLIIS